ncbi:hypothetical protein CEUSTIGMA_g13450.t1 [Chlamydomonas eustigma]|uniref:Uncharacterized protein n=1 Tax=Chlamydomonas eustigma TaxID=1157962 RepID=A0A250XSK4_9CHLO|nr:hypothetical protein CEUSTIGMA_g13450.t1 [Chlamydomonas eustigma]|eukprot:GAX86035.1 hypothetical protein CEUSTIGMA_g13450.t1 [Chlamydomonas eustigma]
MLLFVLVSIRGASKERISLELSPESVVITKLSQVPIHDPGVAKKGKLGQSINDHDNITRGIQDTKAQCITSLSKFKDLTQNMTGFVLCARLNTILRVKKQVSSRTWLLHLLLEDSDKGKCEAVLEIGAGTQSLIGRLQEGHAVCMIGAEVAADLSSAPSWATPVIKTSIVTSEDGLQSAQHPPLILWREANPGCKMYDLTGMLGIMNSSEALMRSAHITNLAQEKWRGEDMLLKIAYVQILNAEVDTRRVHRLCGRPVTRYILDDAMFDSDGDQPEKAASTSAGVPCLAPADCTAATAPCAVRPTTPSRDMNLDGLWECCFCGVECSSSEVTWGFQGTVTALIQRTSEPEIKRQRLGNNINTPGITRHAANSEDAASSDVGVCCGGLGQGSAVSLCACDSAALGGFTGTTAEVWRSMGSIARSRRLQQILRPSNRQLGSKAKRKGTQSAWAKEDSISDAAEDDLPAYPLYMASIYKTLGSKFEYSIALLQHEHDSSIPCSSI